MTGTVRLSSRAKAEYDNLPFELMDEINQQLGDLAEDPTQGVPVDTNLAPGGLIFTCFTINEVLGGIALQINYYRASDEITIIVNSITWQACRI